MTTIDNIILLAASVASFGLLGAVLVRYAQADAAQEKLANVLIRRETQRRRAQVLRKD